MKKTMKSKGISLLEIIIALAILMIILIPISNMALTSMRLENKSNDVQQANVLAQKVMEFIKQSPTFAVDFTNSDLEVWDENDEYTKLKSSNGNKDYYVKVYKYNGENEFTAEKVNPSNESSGVWEENLPNSDLKLKFDEVYMNTLSSKGYRQEGERPILNISYKEHEGKSAGIEYSFKQGDNKIDNNQAAPVIINDKDAVVNIQLYNCSPYMFIDVTNEQDKYIKLFIEKYIDESHEEDSNIPKYTLLRKGKVKTYNRIRSIDDKIKNINRIYKVIIEVYKDSDIENSEPIQRLEGYKYKY